MVSDMCHGVEGMVTGDSSVCIGKKYSKVAAYILVDKGAKRKGSMAGL